MKKPRYPDITLLPRNDVKAALETRRWMIEQGTWEPEYGQVLMMLQDDPEKLLAALADEEGE